MFILHAIWHVPEEETDAFIEWKNVEGAMQQQASGFIKRALYRSNQDPTMFAYLAFWEQEADALGYGRSSEFREKSRAALATMPNTKVTITRMSEVAGQQLLPA
ncbi:MAG: antibiotic biosynthesis monooxygenase [Dehalococcoidia bacterium]